MKYKLGFSKCKMADKEKVKISTGYEVGSVPLIGHNLPCIIDEHLLGFNYLYGGSGDEHHTLKIAPNDVLRLSNVIMNINAEM